MLKTTEILFYITLFLQSPQNVIELSNCIRFPTSENTSAAYFSWYRAGQIGQKSKNSKSYLPEILNLFK